MKLHFYAIVHHYPDEPDWCSPPFVAYNEKEAKAAVLQALYNLSREEEVDLTGNEDFVLCIGEFDPLQISVKGYRHENQKCVFHISDLMQDVAQFEKDGDEND